MFFSMFTKYKNKIKIHEQICYLPHTYKYFLGG